MIPLKVVRVDLNELESAETPERSAGVIEVYLSDGREFSVLACTPDWFDGKLQDLGLGYYFGHSILFVKALKPDIAKKAAKEMAKSGDMWLCLYDTPRTTLSRVLEDFKLKHQN